MVYQLNMDVAINAIRRGFDPLRCIVEIKPYGSSIDFLVVGPDEKPVATVLGLTIAEVLDRASPLRSCSRGACIG